MSLYRSSLFWSMAILLVWLMSGCVVSDTEFSQAVARQDSLHYELVMEQRLNDQLQKYIEEVCYPKVEPNLRRSSLGVPMAAPLAQVDSLPMPNLSLRALDGGKRFQVDRAFRFAPGQTTLTEATQSLLTEVADSLRGYDHLLLEVIGHCDNQERGDSLRIQDGWDLSTQRASATVRFLIGQGVPPHRIMAIGQSKFLPLASNHNRAGRDLNRRVELIIRLNPARP